ncbi:putative inactive receptor kinase [Forsythia ovata]|uniref:Inactive receptor kinase n=1 Tax=Forsythia ovata TaxID=205694 RepID=A0ABD1XAJ8_9LAMI
MHFLILPGKPGGNRAQLDWDTRVRIAVGAARGIAHIHTQKGGKLVHGNIKSSYIFLNSEQYGCVSDLGLANMIATSVKQTEQYHAPEVKNTRNVSQASDVYSFGILLLELLTRKSPLHSTGGDEVVDLVKLVNSVNRKKHTTKVFDVELLRNPDIEEQMVKMLQIGMSCVAKTQKKRPKMSEVVKMMEDIRMMSTRICFLRKKLVFTEGFNPAFDLRDMLRASAEVLGKGMFGNSYKAKLENGITIMVKRLKGVNVTSQAFPQQMEVIGRMRHENVAALMAYYCLNDEILMVYDYYGQGSVFSILHGKLIPDVPMVHMTYWETRLRIAVGAARGIAHIHTQLGQKLIHGNVKASNIFLNAQQYGCVSDGGLITLMGQTALPATRSAGYHAPEVADNKKFSQASDVYSFGIVLLELLTGKVPTHSADDGNVNQLRRWVISVISNDWTLEVFDEELQGVPNTEAAMVQSLKVAMSCVESVPKNRPKMSEVVKMLEDISEIKMGANSPLKQD